MRQSPYAEIQATFLVRTGGAFHSTLDVDRPSVRIASVTGAAYDLWLERNIRYAEIVRARSLDECLRVFEDQELDALAGLRPRLLSDVQQVPGTRILDGCFATVAQAIGTPKSNLVGVKVLQSVIDEIIRARLMESLINKYEVHGLSAVVPIAPRL
nr:transporter substrate-binding domain-containing protein [Bradyrhizobium brasilense]